MKTIYVTELDDGRLANFFTSLITAGPDEDIVPLVHMDPPDLILVDGSLLETTGAKIVDALQESTTLGHVPVVAVFRADAPDPGPWMDTPIDDFLCMDWPEKTLKDRIAFIARRAVRETGMNPLTRLPGAEAAVQRIQAALDAREDAAIARVDIDGMGPFNEIYGFFRGDEVILATGRIIANAARALKEEAAFVGHMGGDDFVFLCPPRAVRGLCEDVIARFDALIENFYNDEDSERGSIVSRGRDGEERTHPILTLAIAVVVNENGRYTHQGQVMKDAMEMRMYLRGLEGSNYMIDRRASRT